MSEIKAKQSLLNLGNAINRLKEVVAQEEDEKGILVDAAIQRFEFCIELFWKTIKRLLQYEGIIASTPKEVLKHAFQQHWFDDEMIWLAMLDDRNKTSHIYDELTAVAIFKRIKSEYSPELCRTYYFLRDKYADLLAKKSG